MTNVHSAAEDDSAGRDSARYWSAQYDRPDEPEQPAASRPDRPRGKRELMREAAAEGASAARPTTAEPPSDMPAVRSAAEALGPARRYLDAALMAGCGVFCFVAAGAPTTHRPGLVVIVGLAALLYGGYIAFSRGGYVMPYSVYALAIIGVVFLIFG